MSMKAIRAIQIMEQSGLYTVNVVYNQIGDDGTIEKRNVKLPTFYATDSELSDPIETVISYINKNKLGNVVSTTTTEKPAEDVSTGSTKDSVDTENKTAENVSDNNKIDQSADSNSTESESKDSGSTYSNSTKSESVESEYEKQTTSNSESTDLSTGDTQETA